MSKIETFWKKNIQDKPPIKTTFINPLFDLQRERISPKNSSAKFPT
jgi:hypothetical protein